jgi:hypothetical protein
MHLYCGNHAGRCLSPGKVCTVVPASCSRSSIADRGSLSIGRSAGHAGLLTPRSEASWSLAAGWLGPSHSGRPECPARIVMPLLLPQGVGKVPASSDLMPRPVTFALVVGLC